MTISTNSTSSFKMGNGFTLHALDLNEGMVDIADAKISSEDQARLDLEIVAHWIFNDTLYAPRLTDLVRVARDVHSAAGVLDERTDRQLAARILQSKGLWTASKPAGVWGNARFMLRFMAAYGRLNFDAEQLKGRITPVQHEYGAVH